VAFNLESINKSWVTPTLAILGGFYAFYHTVLKSDLERTSVDITNRFKAQEIDLERKKFNNDLTMTLFGHVKDAAIGNIKHEKYIVSVVVNQMLNEDTTGFREKLINILLSDSTLPPNVEKSIVNGEEFNRTQILLEKQMTGLIVDSMINHKSYSSQLKAKPFRIDIFYLESGGSEALNAAKILKTKIDSIKYNVKLRLLPNMVNKRVGYRLERNEIRYEQSEKTEALEVFNQGSQQIKLTLNCISYRTPNYISAFIIGK
jgi:hypothetical protein